MTNLNLAFKYFSNCIGHVTMWTVGPLLVINSLGLQSGQCCPSPTAMVGDECGSNTGRGQCVTIMADSRCQGPQYPYPGRDDRVRWPLRFFNISYQHNSKFSGYNCGQCKHVLAGSNCDQRILLHYFLWQYFVWSNYYSVSKTYLGSGQASFGGVDFSYEGPVNKKIKTYVNPMSNMQDMLDDPTFALPYWNFDIKGRECDICNNELLGARSTLDMSSISANSVFCHKPVFCPYRQGTESSPIRRNLAGYVARPMVQKLPEPQDVLNYLELNTFDTPLCYFTSSKSFTNSIEGYSVPRGAYDPVICSLNNLAHLFLNGTGGQTHLLAEDRRLKKIPFCCLSPPLPKGSLTF
uniref:Tyrosinase-related protein 1b n=1 Tax=Cyprinodon variegatus TaxID=28743 RepID=A0A3Q2DFD4_CYPVA